MQFGSGQPNPNTYKTNEYVGMFHYLKDNPNSNTESFNNPTILVDFQTLGFITWKIDPNNSGRLTNINLTEKAFEYYSPSLTPSEEQTSNQTTTETHEKHNPFGIKAFLFLVAVGVTVGFIILPFQ
ncbi:hypothetical protein [Catenovulum agarivorans]|uniref:hypothetical protein n=1 Tax=Catenovulum agarivorans TaxID=1172192 RepID=UPI0003626C74|nr:hypothetical protein [Catenovulum agarivorans]